MSQHTRGQTTKRKALCPSSLGSSAPLVFPSDTRRATTEKQISAVKPNEFGTTQVRNSVTRRGGIFLLILGNTYLKRYFSVKA